MLGANLVLERASGRVQPTLLPEREWQALRDFAALLPATLTDWLYLERWLTAAPVRADLIVRVTPDGRPVLLADGVGFGQVTNEALAWRRLRALARAWAVPGGLLERAVEGLWIEFDRVRNGTPEQILAAPRVFVDLAPATYTSASPEPALQATQACAQTLLGRALDDTLMNGLQRCLAQRPAGVHLIYTGWVPAASSPSLRLCLQGFDDAALLGYLRAVGWPGDLARVERDVLRALDLASAGQRPKVAVAHLDLAPDLLPRLGLEFAFARRPQLQGRLAEQAFLDALVECGLCAPQTLGGLLAWPHCTVTHLPHHIWHSQLAARLSHVKIVLDDGQAPRAKAYLCLFSELLRGGTLLDGQPRRLRADTRPRPAATSTAGSGDGAPAPSPGAWVRS